MTISGRTFSKTYLKTMTTDMQAKTANPDIVYRAYIPSDIEGILQVFGQSVKSLCCDDYSPSQIKAWISGADKARWNREFIERHTTVAVADGRIAGFCDCESNGHIDRLYVSPEFAFKGIGAALVADAEKSHGNPVSTVEASLTAKPFFEKLGYTVIEKQSVFRRGEYLTNFRMKKAL